MTIGIAPSSIAFAAGHSLSFASSTSRKPIRAKLLKPDGNGPFPGVVILYDCSGLGSRSSGSPMRWAQDLVSQGYAVVLPDSFTPRGFPNGVCTLPRRVSHVAMCTPGLATPTLSSRRCAGFRTSTGGGSR